MKFKAEDFDGLELTFGTFRPNDADKEKLAARANAKLGEWLSSLQALVNEQAEDVGLWSLPVGRLQFIAEAHLQQELRKLHKLIEEVKKTSP